MTKTPFILSRYNKRTCKILNYSAKMYNLTVKRKLYVELESFDMYT